MVNFELGEEIEREISSFCHNRGTKKKSSGSPWKIDLKTFGFRVPMLYLPLTEPQRLNDEI